MSDSEDDLMNPIKIPEFILAELLDDDDDEDEAEMEMEIVVALLGLVDDVCAVRIPHVRITNYVEHVVPNYSDEDFLMHFRLRREVTYKLISQFSEHEIYTSLLEHSAGRTVLSADKHVLTFLWFVGHQTSSYRDVADRFNMTLSSLYNIISRVTDFILTLSDSVIRLPNAAEKKRTSDHFFNKKGYPGAIAAIDGSHIKIDRPKDDPDSYYNRKKFHSIQVQGVVDEELKFIDVFVGYPGAVHDARVFRNSDIFENLDDLCTGGYHILGDSAYPLMTTLMVPFKDNGHLTAAQKFFNRRHSSCRVIVENVFGILKQRFRQLYHLKLRRIDRIVKIIHACCILHNIASIDDVRFFEPPVLDCENGLPDAQNEHIIDHILDDQPDAKTVRDGICNQVFTRR